MAAKRKVAVIVGSLRKGSFIRMIARAMCALAEPPEPPEYNRSVPGVLKSAIDIGFRPYGQSVWSGKPAAVVSSSASGLSGFGANHHCARASTCRDAAARSVHPECIEAL